MFCKNCGKELEADVKYCPDCGTCCNKVSGNHKINSGLVFVLVLFMIIGLVYVGIRCFSTKENQAEVALNQLSIAIYNGDYEAAEQYADFESITDNFYTDYYAARYEKDKADLKEVSAKAYKENEVNAYLDDVYRRKPERDRKDNLSVMRQVIKKAIRINKTEPQYNAPPRNFSWTRGNDEEENIQYLIYLSQQYEPKVKYIDIDGDKGIANVEFKAKTEHIDPQIANVKLEMKRNSEGKWKVVKIANVDELFKEHFKAENELVRIYKDYYLRYIW